jgi:hypothetical protein
MTWQFIVVLTLAVPVILFPIALIWFLDIEGIVKWIKRARKRKALQQKEVEVMVSAEQIDI